MPWRPQRAAAPSLDAEITAADLSLTEAPDSSAFDLAGCFINDQAQDIFYSTESGDYGVIARSLLASPIDSVTLATASLAPGKFNLYGTIDYAYDQKKASERVLNLTAKALGHLASARGVSLGERGGNIIYESSPGIHLIVGRARGLRADSQLIVSTANVKEGYDDLIRLLPELTLDSAIFRSALADTLGAMAVILRSSYGDAYPDQPVWVLPPKSPSLLDGSNKQGRAPKDIKSKFGAEIPSVALDEVGGNARAKEEIKWLAYGIEHPEAYREGGITPPKGILLYGPPGTGKTLLAKVLASQANASFYYVKVTDIRDMWYGNSEKYMQEVFDEAARQERSIIFFDEVDALTLNRDKSHEASGAVLSIINQNMDGLSTTDNVYVVAATNKRQNIDPSMLRPGRLTVQVEVDLPDEDGRDEIFRIHMGKARELAGVELFDETVDPRQLATCSDELSGADIQEVLRRALEKRVRYKAQHGHDAPLVSHSAMQAMITDYIQEKPSDS
jgi:AAA+ superfamily predicted ATPase